jgi:DNA-directed RNA polymerase subunit B
VASDKELVEFVSSDPDIQKSLIPTLEAGVEINSSKDALDYIGNRVAIGQTSDFRIQRAEQILDKYLLPHLEMTPNDRKKKALFLGQMAEKIIELSLGRRKADDKDHYANKRLKLAGDLLASLFRVAFKSFCRDMKYQLERSYARRKDIKIASAIRPDLLSQRLLHALATGNWVGGRAGRSGDDLQHRRQLQSGVGPMANAVHQRRAQSPVQPHRRVDRLRDADLGRLCQRGRGLRRRRPGRKLVCAQAGGRLRGHEHARLARALQREREAVAGLREGAGDAAPIVGELPLELQAKL